MSDFRQHILALVEEHIKRERPNKAFVPGDTYIPATGKLVGVEEAKNMVEAAIDLELTTTGKWNSILEHKLAEFMEVDRVITCNSGSSANLLAVSALCSPMLGGMRLVPGDEVICAAVGFPTTVNPIIQNGLVPVFVDSLLPYYNINADAVADAIGPKTKAIFLDHTLGNPCEMEKLSKIAYNNGLWIINDTCDAMGAKYQGNSIGKWGCLGTMSFYPAHTMTTGEGGAVYTNDKTLEKIVESLSNWGRHCVCPPNHDNVCGKRFEQQHGGLPYGFDHKYVFSNLGYNFKMTDMQAACGVAQAEKLPYFIKLRELNFNYLYSLVKDLEEYIVLPKSLPGASPSWFSFPMTLIKSEHRLYLLRYLESKKIGTRLLFGGNLTRQPYIYGREMRIHGDLSTADTIMNSSFCVGIFPAITPEMMEYVSEVLHKYFKEMI